MITIDLRQSVLVYTPENTQFDFWLTLNYHKQLGIEKTSTKPYTNLAPTGKKSTYMYIIKLLTVNIQQSISSLFEFISHQQTIHCDCMSWLDPIEL